jgi:hypothetical protein
MSSPDSRSRVGRWGVENFCSEEFEIRGTQSVCLEESGAAKHTRFGAAKVGISPSFPTAHFPRSAAIVI